MKRNRIWSQAGVNLCETYAIRKLADKNFELLKADPHHPSLHFKKIDQLWSVRVGAHYRALGVDQDDTIVWFWIGSHSDYDKLV